MKAICDNRETAGTNTISLTTHEFFQGDTEDTPACQRGGMCAHCSAGLLEEVVSEPPAEPLQSAVTQEAAGVQITAGVKQMFYSHCHCQCFFFPGISATPFCAHQVEDVIKKIKKNIKEEPDRHTMPGGAHLLPCDSAVTI